MTNLVEFETTAKALRYIFRYVRPNTPTSIDEAIANLVALDARDARGQPIDMNRTSVTDRLNEMVCLSDGTPCRTDGVESLPGLTRVGDKKGRGVKYLYTPEDSYLPLFGEVPKSKIVSLWRPRKSGEPRKSRGSKKLPEAKKEWLYAVQGGVCYLCGRHRDDIRDLVDDHVDPFIEAGDDPEFKNRALACHYCNGAKRALKIGAVLDWFRENGRLSPQRENSRWECEQALMKAGQFESAVESE